MLFSRIALATLAWALCCLAANQDILTILNQQTGISTFTGLLEQFPALVDTLNGGTFSGRTPWKESTRKSC